MSQKKTARPSGQVHGVLLVDKPAGMTSFDVVAQVRKAFGTRRVGHAGTLDPMATGVLVILLGEATKLSNVLTTDQKSYRTKIALGITTDSLDKDGKITRKKPLLAPLTVELVEAALAEERSRRDQIPPQVSAIKVEGKRAYQQARKGIEVDLAARIVKVHELALLDIQGDHIELALTVSKGYYVRSLGRDLADHLGTVGHLIELRRTRSGPFREEQTVKLPISATLPLYSVEQVAKLCLPVLEVNPQGALCISQGKRLESEDIIATCYPPESAVNPHGKVSFAAFFENEMIALLEIAEANSYRVQRGLSNQNLVASLAARNCALPVEQD